MEREYIYRVVMAPKNKPSNNEWDCMIRRICLLIKDTSREGALWQAESLMHYLHLYMKPVRIRKLKGVKP